MITIKAIEKEISDIKYEIENSVLTKPHESRLRNRIIFLKDCIRYIQTNPSIEFIESESKRLEKFISAKAREFWNEKYDSLSKADVTKLKKEFEKDYDIPEEKNTVTNIEIFIVQ